MSLSDKFLDERKIGVDRVLPSNAVISLWGQGVEDYGFKVIRVVIMTTRSRIGILGVNHQLQGL